jgi:methyl-accepting chemotaxis protein
MNLDAMYQNQLQAILHLKNAVIDLYNIKVSIRSAMLTTDLQLTDELVKLASDSEVKFKEDMTAYEKLIITEQARKTYGQAMKDYAEYEAVANKILDLAAVNKNEEAAQLLFSEAVPLANAVEDSMNELVTIKEGQAKDYYVQSGNVFAQSGNLVIVFTIITVLVGAAVAFFLSRTISGAARQMEGVA